MWLWTKATDKQFAAIMIAGLILFIGLMLGGCAIIGNILRLWGCL